MARLLVAASSQYIDLGNVYDATVDFSVAMLVTRHAAGARHDLISKEAGSADGHVLTIQFSDLVAFGVFNGGYPVVESTTSIGSGVTAHLLGVRDDAAGLLRMFVNGTQEATASAGGAPTPSGDNLNIGRRPSGGGLNYADATISEVAIWDAALTADEAAMLAKGLCPLLVRPQSLVAYLPLYGRFSGEPDLVGGITGTVSGATAAEHPRIYRPARSMVAVPTAGGGATSILRQMMAHHG
jgi:hypothetical protein